MSTWALLLVLHYSDKFNAPSTSQSITSGFSSEKTCKQAGDKLIDTFIKSSFTPWYSCIEVK